MLSFDSHIIYTMPWWWSFPWAADSAPGTANCHRTKCGNLCTDICVLTHMLYLQKIVAWAGVHIHDQYATLFWNYYTTVFHRYVPCWTSTNMWLAKTQSPTTCRWGRWGQKHSFPQASITGVRLPYSTTGRSVSGNKSEMMFLGRADQAWSALRYNIIYIYMYVIHIYRHTSSTVWEYVVELMAIPLVYIYIPWIFVGSYVWNLWIFWLIYVDIYGNLYCRVAGWPMVQTWGPDSNRGKSSWQITSDILLACRKMRGQLENQKKSNVKNV